MREDLTWKWINQDAEAFQKNSEAISKLLLNSGTGQTADFYKKQIFSEFSPEEIEEHDKAKAELFNKKWLQKNLRPDLGD